MIQSFAPRERKRLSTPPLSLRSGTSDLDCTFSRWWRRRRRSWLLVLRLELVGKGKLGRLLLELGELVFILGDLLEGGLDELALHVGHGHVKLIDAEIAQDDLALQEEHLALEVVPLIEELGADLLEVVDGGGLEILLGPAPLADHPLPLGGLPLLLLLELLDGLLPQEGPELLLPLGGHKPLLLRHGDFLL